MRLSLLDLPWQVGQLDNLDLVVSSRDLLCVSALHVGCVLCAGLLYAYSLNYDIVFNIAGVAMIGAGVIFCAVHLPCLAPFRFDLVQKAAEQRRLAAENDDI